MQSTQHKMTVKPHKIEIPIMEGGDSRVLTAEAEEPRAGGESRCGCDFPRDTTNILPALPSPKGLTISLTPQLAGATKQLSLARGWGTAPQRRLANGLHFPACTSGRGPEGQSNCGDLVLACVRGSGQ